MTEMHEARSSGGYGKRSQERMAQTSKHHLYTSESLLYLSVLMCAFTALFLTLLPEYGGIHTLGQLTDNGVTLKDHIQPWLRGLKQQAHTPQGYRLK